MVSLQTFSNQVQPISFNDILQKEKIIFSIEEVKPKMKHRKSFTKQCSKLYFMDASVMLNTISFALYSIIVV
jgi:hypothetical protein